MCIRDRFIENAFEFDVDALCDGKNVFIAGIMQHIEQAGIHSGDSSCVLPAHKMSNKVKKEIIDVTTKLAKALNVVGLINLQFAVKDETVYVLEVNPRSSRTCLLYTSPSPRDLSTSRMPSSA